MQKRHIQLLTVNVKECKDFKIQIGGFAKKKEIAVCLGN